MFVEEGEEEEEGGRQAGRVLLETGSLTKRLGSVFLTFCIHYEVHLIRVERVLSYKPRCFMVAMRRVSVFFFFPGC